jgi:PKHD-type hydroxylase
MILSFEEVISEEEHRALLGKIAQATFVDGRETAGGRLSEHKRNEQISRQAPEMAEITQLVLAALKRHEAFRNATYPQQLHSVMVSRYRPGMEYGWHVDEAVMGDAVPWRSDLSLTLFLNAPTDYDGGELALESGSGQTTVKLSARAMVCYPTGQLHCVQPVTRGERLAVIGWIQSLVRDGGAREALWDLAQAREQVYAREGKSRTFDLINKTHANLLRRWAQA